VRHAPPVWRQAGGTLRVPDSKTRPRWTWAAPEALRPRGNAASASYRMQRGTRTARTDAWAPSCA